MSISTIDGLSSKPQESKPDEDGVQLVEVQRPAEQVALQEPAAHGLEQRSCPAVSTPSATTSIARVAAQLDHAGHSAAPRGSVSMSATNSRSIFRMSTGSRAR